MGASGGGGGAARAQVASQVGPRVERTPPCYTLNAGRTNVWLGVENVCASAISSPLRLGRQLVLGFVRDAMAICDGHW